MDNWITLISFGFPEVAEAVKSKLEAEGIETVLKEEFSSNTISPYSTINEGTKIEIKEQDIESATKILIDLGYISVEKPTPNKFMIWLDGFTAKIPFVRRTILELRLVIFIFLSLAFIFILAFGTIKLLTMPSKKEKVISKTWIIDKLYFEGEQLYPNTTDKVFINESALIVFNKYGIVFTGFNSGIVRAKWTFEFGKLSLNQVDSLKHIFEGEYSIEVSDSTLEIESDKLKVICHSLY